MKYLILISIFAIFAASCGDTTTSTGNDFESKEFLVEHCQDKIDNDNDGKIDCEDEGCQGYTFCQKVIKTENTAVDCQDQLDNDGDEKIDCEDEDCQGFIFCTPQLENTADLCNDRLDNDNDGKIDCDDTACKIFTFCKNQQENTATACSDELDNDADGDVDCEDTDCQVFTFCMAGAENTSTACKDNQDNDNDGKIDCEDEDCQGFTFCETEILKENSAVLCQDNQDNDGDEKIDCQDEDCQGFTFCANEIPVENSAISCQDEIDNDGDGKIDCLDEDCQGFTFCGTFNTEDSSSKCQDEMDNDNDGKIDCEDTDCWQFSFCNIYNGSPITDSWGDTWDSVERGKKTWEEAKAICENLGGRLPTVTELYRNNSNLTGDLGSYQTNYLWTLISSYSNNYKISVRLTDGNRTQYVKTNKQSFRCVWPNDDNNGFDSKKCYGEPNNECFKYDYYYNIDNYNRPPLPYTAAVNECNFYGSSLMVLDEYENAIHAGLPNGNNSWNWLQDYYGNNLIGVRWRDDGAENWTFINGTYGTYLGTTTYYNFRCIGVADTTHEYQQGNPVCYGGCFENNKRVSSIKSDSEDRDAETYSSAIETCRNLGGQIHNLREYTDNIHSGWENGSNTWLWLTNIYSSSVVLGRWNGVGTEYFNISSSNSSPTGSQKVRCVWHKKKPALPTCGNVSDVLKWNGTEFVCEASVSGSSNGNAYNSDEKIDSWGNAWDGVQRPGQYYEDAKADCESMGGRLPTATELYKVNATTPIVSGSSIGTTGQTGYLWTTIKTYTVNQNIAMRISDGATQRVYTTSNSTSYKRPYRCIWPISKSDILIGVNCNGAPGNECFTTDSLIVDSYDRVALDHAAAVNDCMASGGHLPDGGEYAMLIHEGLVNGSNEWLWMSEAIYSNSIQMLRWNGTGSTTWPNSTNRFTSSSYSTNRKFRCVYHKILK